MGTLSWDVVQNRVLVCVQWGDDIADDVWDELGDAVVRSRSVTGFLPVLIISDGRGATDAQLRRARRRLSGPHRLAFMTRSSAAMDAARAAEGDDVHVAIVDPGDFVGALVHLHLPDSLLAPVVVTVARLSREAKLQRLRESTWESPWITPPKRMMRLE